MEGREVFFVFMRAWRFQAEPPRLAWLRKCHAALGKLIIALLVFIIPPMGVLAQESVSPPKKVALVVGNAEYKFAESLKNPANDAADVRERLLSFGFEIFGGIDLSLVAMNEQLIAFGRAARQASVVLFFYAGHGIQLQGENFIVPTDAKMEYPDEADIVLMPVSRVVQQMQRSSGTLIVVLDACRNNPFQTALSRSVVSLQPGLAMIKLDKPAFVAYSTGANSVALDGEGRNSPFTAALVSHLGERGLTMVDMMQKVAANVQAATDGRQTPWVLTSLTGAFYLNPNPPVAKALDYPTEPPADPDAELNEFTIRVLVGDVQRTRTWRRQNPNLWIEIYHESGLEVAMSAVKRMKLGKCVGTAVAEDGAEGKLAFIPDRDCPDMAFRISHWSDHWAVAARIENPQ